METKFPINLTNPDVAYGDVESVKLIFSQCEDCLKESQIITDNITSRAYTLISFVVGLMVVIVGYLASHLHPFYENIPDNVSCILSVAFLMSILYNLKENVLPTSYYRIGIPPEYLYTDDMFSPEISNADRIVFLYMGMTEDYRNKIDMVDEKNFMRQLLLKKSINRLYIFPVLFFVIYFFVSIILCNTTCC